MGDPVTMGLFAASTIMSGMATRTQNRAARAQQNASNEAVGRQLGELQRQEERELLIAQEEKSDRARELDIEMGQMLAQAADGGQTAATTARFAGAISGAAGLDKARIESNRIESAAQKRAMATSIIEENLAQQDQTNRNIQGNTMAFFGNAFSAGIKFSGGTKSKPEDTKPDKPPPPVIRRGVLSPFDKP